MADDIVIVPLRKVIFDLLLLQLVGWPILFLFLWGNPFQRGFFCEDDSIRHPFHESTVPSWTLYITGFGLNIITMTLTEILNRPNDRKSFYFLGRNIPYWVYNVYCAIGMMAFGAACCQLSTDVMKYTIGHSSFSMYTMVYFSIYIHRRMTWDGSKLLRHTLQFLAVLSSVFTGMTRVSDYKHHWSDVLAGLVIGTIIAYIVARYFSTLFSSNLHHADSPEHSELNGHSNTRTTAIGV